MKIKSAGTFPANFGYFHQKKYEVEPKESEEAGEFLFFQKPQKIAFKDCYCEFSAEAYALYLEHINQN